MSDLRTDYKDDVLAPSMNGKRQFNIVDSEGNILFEDIHIEDTSSYVTVGDHYGGDTINEQNTKINSLDSGKQDKLTNPLTQSDVVNNLTSTATNKPLSAAQGKTVNDKVKTYPKILNCVGEIANSVGGAAIGTGVATVTLYASGLAKIDYQYTITTAGTSTATTNFKWGLNRDLLSARNANIPTITPVNGGVAEWYAAKSNSVWSSLHESYNGYGCTHTVNSQFWCAARNHNGTSVGAYPVSTAVLNIRICGTCYGTFTVT